MDLELKGLQIKKQENALQIAEKSKEKIQNLKDENEQLKINADLSSENIKNNSSLRGFEKIEQENNLRGVLNAKLRRNNDIIIQHNKIVEEFTNISSNASDTVHDYNVIIADNTGKVNTNTSATDKNTDSIEDNTKAIDEANKRRLQDIDDYNDYLLAKEELENEYLDSELDPIDKEINDVNDKYFTLIEQAKAYGKDATLLEEARLSNIADINKKYSDIAQNEQDAIDAANKLKEEEAAAKRIQQIKENAQLTNDLLNIGLENSLKRIDTEIEKRSEKIEESQSAVNNLQEQANLGNLDAEASIKAEKQKIANEKLNIDALEKKKRDLQILVTGLALANEKIQSGDGNALGNASADMGTFISTLKGFYDGTDTTLGADLGNSYAISGDKDTHIIKAHKDEHIIGVKNSRKLGGMSQDDIVKGALMLKNGEFVGNRAVKNLSMTNDFNDVRMVNAMKQNTTAIEQAIKNIPQKDINYDAISKIVTERIKTGNTTTNNHKNIGGRLW